MRCCAHAKAMEVFLDDPNLIQMLGSSIFGVTTNILDEYNQLLGSHSFFNAWFAHANMNRRLDVFDAQNQASYAFPGLASIKPDYLGAAYFSGMNLLLSTSQVIANVDEATLDNWGIHRHHIETVLGTPFVSFGDNPIYEINFTKGGKLPLKAVSNFCSNEKQLVIYDKYINAKAMHLICDCCKQLDSNATVTVITGKPQAHCLSVIDIKNQLKQILPIATITCEIANTSTLKEHHDRYMFIGERLQMTFSRGLDIFGDIDAHGDMINESGTVSIYSTLKASFVAFGLRSGTSVQVRKHQ
jgi:hypothetical protein